MNTKKMFKSAVLIIIISIFSRVLGFVRETMMAATFGANNETDAYMVAITIPNIIFLVLSPSIINTFIPILNDSSNEDGQTDMFKFTNTVINLLILVSLVLFVVAFIFSPLIVKLVAPNISEDTYKLAVQLTKISVLSVLFMSLYSGHAAILQHFEDFTAPTLGMAILNIPIIVYILLGANSGIKGLAVATVCGIALQEAILIPWLFKKGYRYSLKINLKDIKVKKMMLLIFPIIIGSAVNQINVVVDKIMASGLEEGSISALNYADKVNSMIYTVFALTIVTIIYPSMSKLGESLEHSTLKSYISKSMQVINYMMIPASLVIMVFSTQMVSLLFKHGNFDEKAASLTTSALLFYSIGLIFYGPRDVLNRAFYSLKDTKTPMRNGILSVVMNIILSGILSKVMGIGGLALSSSISAFISFVLLSVSLSRKIGRIYSKKYFIMTSKTIFSSLIMGIVLIVTFKRVAVLFTGFKGQILSLMISIVVGGIIYVLSLIISGAVDVTKFRATVIKKYIRKNEGDIISGER